MDGFKVCTVFSKRPQLAAQLIEFNNETSYNRQFQPEIEVKIIDL